MTQIRPVAACAALLFLAAPAAAQEHSHQHPTDSLGTVHFPTSCAPAVAPRFDRAVALLHSFEFGASIRAFGEVAAADSSCAMAQWGIALSRWSNPMSNAARDPAQLQRGRDAARTAARLGSGATERERLYIAAVGRLYDDFERVDQSTRLRAYERAMADLVLRQPADTEAKIFHAIALVAAASPTDKTYAAQVQAGSILEPIWAKQPNHPGLAHYIIHAYDVPALAPRAAAAAKRYAVIAPAAAHALHMPSHTFTRLGQWEQSIATNRRSMAAALQTGSIAEALHAADYSEYAYLQLARDSEAKALVDSLPALAARFDVNAVTGAAPGSAGVFALAAIPARWAVERRDWAAAAALTPQASGFRWTEATVHFARALGAAHLGDTTAARAAADSLDVIGRSLAARDPYWAEQVAIQHLAARAWLHLAQRRPDSALARMREAARREDGTEKSAVSPAPIAPARELLGDMLLDLGRPREALVEYRATLKVEANRFRALYGAMQAARRAGDRKAAAEYRSALRTLTAGADRTARRELRELR